MDEILKLKNLSKSFSNGENTVNVLNDFSLDIMRGEFVSILGPSGCGKSTLLKLIISLLSSDTGEIKFQNGGANEKQICSMIFQEPRLMPWLSVEKNIDFVLPSNMKKEQKKELIARNLELVGLTDFRKAYPYQLSGGMQQRASIARELSTEPEILLLDEPFSALDAFTRMSMQTELRNIWEKKGTTMILVTHDIDEAIFLSNRIVIMSNKTGSIDRVLDNDIHTRTDRSSTEFLDMRRKILRAFFAKNEDMLEYII